MGNTKQIRDYIYAKPYGQRDFKDCNREEIKKALAWNQACNKAMESYPWSTNDYGYIQNRRNFDICLKIADSKIRVNGYFVC